MIFLSGIHQVGKTTLMKKIRTKFRNNLLFFSLLIENELKSELLSNIEFIFEFQKQEIIYTNF